MKLWPYERFSLISPLDQSEAVAKIQAQIAPQKFRFFSKPDELFSGNAAAEGFKLRRNTLLNNRFKPVIIGSFVQHHEGIKIEVRQRLSIVTGLAVALVTLCFASSIYLVEEYREGYIFLFLFFWVVVTGCFWFVGRQTKKDITALLNARDADLFV